MRKLFSYILLVLLGFLLGLFIVEKNKNKHASEQVEIIQNGIKNVSKLVVVEETYTQFYNYKDSDLYFFDTFNFDKLVILTLTAKVLVSYDLTKMETEIDSVHKKIIIHKIPEEELNIIPTFKYYDFQQSVFNSFNKEDLNMIQKSSLDKLTKQLALSKPKNHAKERLLVELDQLWQIAKILGWTIEDQTENKIVSPIFEKNTEPFLD